MKLTKRTLFQIHSWIGIKLSILFFIVCFSGTIATLSNELDWLFNPAFRANPSDIKVPKNEIRDNLAELYPGGNLTYWMRPEAPYLCDIVYVQHEGKQRYVFANPYTGDIQGAVGITIQRYFRDLHYYLFIPFQIGHFTVLIFAFLLLFSLLTALLFYKKWYRKLFELKTGNGLLVLMRSLHRLVGLWSIPFALLFALTGIWYFIERADVGNVSNDLRVEVPKVDSTTYGSNGYQTDLVFNVDYDRAIDSARAQIPGLIVQDILPPYAQGAPLYLNGTSQVKLVRNRANRVYLHPVTYEVLMVQRAEDINTATWLNDIADPLHFGYWGGLITKIIWFVMGMGISGLVLSGIWIALKRKSRSIKKQQPALGLWKYVNWLATGVMFFFMYYFLVTRYAVQPSVIVAVTICWSLVIGLAYWIYVIRIKKQANPKQLKNTNRPLRKTEGTFK